MNYCNKLHQTPKNQGSGQMAKEEINIVFERDGSCCVIKGTASLIGRRVGGEHKPSSINANAFCYVSKDTIKHAFYCMQEGTLVYV